MGLKVVLLDSPFRLEKQVPAGQTSTLELKRASYAYYFRADAADGAYYGAEGSLLLNRSEEWVFSIGLREDGRARLSLEKNPLRMAGRE